MHPRSATLVVSFVILLSLTVRGQRVYRGASVLATGTWYKIAVPGEGVYRVDVALLNSLGINTTNLSSATIRVFGNGGAMLPENNGQPRMDDLAENALDMSDGGDGLFNGSDYFLFYAPGPHIWVKDSLNRTFRHRKNLYADSAYYFITIAGQGSRIGPQAVPAASSTLITSYQERYFYENDLVNLLHSGKEWYGEVMSNNPGAPAGRVFSVDWPGLLVAEPVTLVTELVARSVGATGDVGVKVNNVSVPNMTFPGVTGNYLDPYAISQTRTASVFAGQPKMDIGFSWTSTAAGAQCWLNWFELHGRRSLSMQGSSPLFFRDWQTVSAAVGRFQVGSAGAATQVWDITTAYQPQKMRTTLSGSQLQFENDLSRLREYVAFNPATLPAPVAVGRVPSQDLHGSAMADLLVVTHSSLLSEAERLAQFHRQRDGYEVLVVTTDQVANEFGSGVTDPAASRDFVKMHYDRANRTGGKKPRWLLLFGTASYQYKPGAAASRSLVPGHQGIQSLDPLNTYTTDDFFGLLDDTDDITRDDPAMQLDIGIGRIPARNTAEARTMVDKIIRYHTPAGLGAWRNQVVFVADDGDGNLHLQDAESVAASAVAVNPVFNQRKLYLDAYPLVAGSGGARYPAVNDAIVNQVSNGVLMLNYSGHGSYQRLAEEAVLTQQELNRFQNADRLPLFITASCDFAPHDDPALGSLGSGLLVDNANGAIGLLTTTRVVFAYSNRQINDNYQQVALQRGADGRYLTLGESMREAKNRTMQATGDVINNRKFTLLGDPAMRLGFPEAKARLKALNGRPAGSGDTLRAQGKYRFEGEITDAAGNLLPAFSGKLTLTVYDKPQQIKTMGNTSASPVTTFTEQAAVLYKGDVTVSSGLFAVSFVLPKDISYQPGRGRISLYADNGTIAANGIDTTYFIGGATTPIADTKGPDILPYINDQQFQDGGITDENPVLLLKLFDSSGISISGFGIGHDITAIIDGNERDVRVLNDNYVADLDSYQSGRVRYQLPQMDEGMHTIRIKAWDVVNNSSEVTIRFQVAAREKLQVRQVRNFPNPFQNGTRFGFEHNQPNRELDVSISVYTESGALVKQIHQVVNTGGSRNCEIIWSGDNAAGAKLPKGGYIYRMIVKAGGQQQIIGSRLIIL